MAEQALLKAGLPSNIVIDCSHANSYKKPELQPLVMADVVNQVRLGNQSLVGMMVESNLVAGNQADPRRPVTAEVRLLGHRRLRRLGEHRKDDPRRRPLAARGAADARRLTLAANKRAQLGLSRGALPDSSFEAATWRSKAWVACLTET
jgi:hypothetical protein